MRLTTLSDYALRVLMYAATQDQRLITIAETAQLYGISRSHLMKVVNMLTRAGYLQGVRGRTGGFRLAIAPAQLRLGDVLRVTEPDFAMVECLAGDKNCILAPSCRLPSILRRATASFLATMDEYTLADLLASPEGGATVAVLYEASSPRRDVELA